MPAPADPRGNEPDYAGRERSPGSARPAGSTSECAHSRLLRRDRTVLPSKEPAGRVDALRIVEQIERGPLRARHDWPGGPRPPLGHEVDLPARPHVRLRRIEPEHAYRVVRDRPQHREVVDPMSAPVLRGDEL